MISRQQILSFAGMLALVLICGCADPVVFSEVFQLQKGQELYTNYNIWYSDPQEISCLNIQQGGFIPLGTVIEPIGTDSFPEKIHFKVKSTGKVFSIRFKEGYRLCTMRDYIASTFSTTDPLKTIPEKTAREQKVKERIRRGEVVPGMTRRDVELAYGPPPAVRTPDKRNETWIYWRSPELTIRVIFRDDVVRHVLNLNDEL